MNNEEKILAILEKHGEMLEKLSSRMDQLQEAQEQMQTTQEQMQTTQEQMQAAQEQMQTAQEQMQATQKKMQDDLTSVKLRLELDVEKRFDAMNESIDTILKKLETLDEVKELAEETRDRVDVIHAVVTQHSRDIETLKVIQ